MKISFEVIDPFAATIGGERVVDGVVRLTDVQAAHYLRMGVIRGLEKMFLPDPPSPPRHPLDHDGDGRKGGSLPGRKVRKRRKSVAGVTGLPPTNFSPEEPSQPPMPYLPRADEPPAAEKVAPPWEE